jgi:Copper amine oxidase, enzyme domain
MQSALWLRLISHAQTCLRTASQIMYSVAPLVPRLVPGTGLTPRRPFISLPNTNLHRVIYFNLGSHHVPHSGDIPNTLMHTSASSVMFTPFNFHDRDPSRHSVQGVRLNLGGEHPEPRYFGGRHEKDVNLKVVSLTTIMCGKSMDSIVGYSHSRMGEEHARQLHPSPGRFQSITPTLSPVLGEYS